MNGQPHSTTLIKNKSGTLQIKPYGLKDPYANLELMIAGTSVFSELYDADQMPILTDHRHMTPFEHQSATFLITAPIFVIREWHRHRTQAYNEMSMRYTDDPVGKFYTPAVFRAQATRNKQSSAGYLRHQTAAHRVLEEAYANAISAYDKLISLGVCREQARAVIPVGNYSTFYATASLRNWAGFCALRVTGEAQWEIRQYGKGVDRILQELWPDSWNCLRRQFEDSIG